ncbi:MAG: deaminase domain-containing protein [Kiritimatiellia bacterium]
MNQTRKIWILAAWAGWTLSVSAVPTDQPGTNAPEAACVSADAAARKPVVRHLDKKTDAADLKRIWHCRKKLPEPFYRRNNFGWAWAEIDGLEKKEYFAHSGIQNFDGFSKTVARRLKDMSFSPEKGKGKFQTLLVDWRGNLGGPDALPRWFDTEYKMLEDIAARLPDPAVSGKIRLYTNLEPCPSCRGVMDQFLAIYTNVEMLVFYEWPP